MTFSTANVHLEFWANLYLYVLIFLFFFLTLRFLDSVYYIKIILTTKSILLPSVEIPVVLGGFLLLLWLKDQTNLPDLKKTHILYGYSLGRNWLEKSHVQKQRALLKFY